VHAQRKNINKASCSNDYGDAMMNVRTSAVARSVRALVCVLMKTVYYYYMFAEPANIKE